MDLTEEEFKGEGFKQRAHNFFQWPFIADMPSICMKDA
jgi:hypothetical protein